MLNSEFTHFTRTAFNPFMPNGISHRYQLEQSITVLRDVRWYFSFYSSFNRKIMQANSGDPDQTPHFVALDLGLHYLPMSHKKDVHQRHCLVVLEQDTFILA